MSGLSLDVTVTGFDEFGEELQRYRNAIADRQPLHAKMAVDGAEFTRDYLRGHDRHATAERLGAKPTGFHAKNAQKLEADSDDEAAIIRIPRNTGLGRAFHDVIIFPGSGRTYLTIPAHSTTYGKSVRSDFPADTFTFAFLGRFRALVYADGPFKGVVGYWLKRSVSQKQDRTLLPSDSAYALIARNSAVEYISNHIDHAP